MWDADIDDEERYTSKRKKRQAQGKDTGRSGPPPPEEPEAEGAAPPQLAEEEVKPAEQKSLKSAQPSEEPNQEEGEEEVKVKKVKRVRSHEDAYYASSDTDDEEEDEEEQAFDMDMDWIKCFSVIKWFCIVCGRWPLTYQHKKNRQGYKFKFSWSCPGFIFFAVTFVFTVFCLIVSSINIVNILMEDKLQNISERTNTAIIEQGLCERHTMIVIIVLGSYGINLITSCFIFAKRHEVAIMFSKWTRFIRKAKLGCGTWNSYIYVGVTFGNFVLVSSIYLVLTFFGASATFIGGPTVVSIMLLRNFCSDNYMDEFSGSFTHWVFNLIGLLVYFHLIITCNAYMYLFLWLLKSIENGFSLWNARVNTVVESTSGEEIVQVDEDEQEEKRTTFQLLYNDHIGMVRMLLWFNKMFAYSLEPYVLFLTVKIVYEFYLAALVVASNGKPLGNLHLGQYFIRKRDYIPAILLTYESVFMILAILLAGVWFEDTAYDSYEDLRKNALLKGQMTDKEALFYMSIFQSFTSTTSMSIYGAWYFCIGRYSILHVLSAIMSNFLVIYQFNPLFDMDTSNDEAESDQRLRSVFGTFLVNFEGLPENHTVPVSDSVRNMHGS